MRLRRPQGWWKQDSGFRIQDSGKAEDLESRLCAFRLVTRLSSLVTGLERPLLDIYEAIRQGLNIDLQILRAGCDDETTWQQEYCCQFISIAENFIPPALVAQCASAEAAKDCPPQFLASAPHLVWIRAPVPRVTASIAATRDGVLLGHRYRPPPRPHGVLAGRTQVSGSRCLVQVREALK